MLATHLLMSPIFVFSRDVWIRTQRAAVANRRAINLYFFGGLECVGLSFAYVAHFCIFERCLDSNPESCRSKQARYQLSHPSLHIFLNLHTVLYTVFHNLRLLNMAVKYNC